MPVAWGLGTWTEWRAGGHRVGVDNSTISTPNPHAPLFFSYPSLGRATSLLTQNVCRPGTGQARRPGHSDAAPRPETQPNRRPPAPFTQRRPPRLRPGRSPGAPKQTNRPSRRSRPPAPPAARPQPPCQARPAQPVRGPLVNPCSPARPLIGGGGAPGQRRPLPPQHLSRPLPHCRHSPPPGTPPPLRASQPCKSREETRGFTSVFTPITTNPDRTDPD